MDGVVDASTAQLGAFHEKIAGRVHAIATRRKRRNEDVDEATEEGKPPTNDNEEQEPDDAGTDARSTRHASLECRVD